MTDAEWQARVQLAACYRIFDMGWTEMIYNHITLRVPGPERHFLINPFGLHYREVTASNLMKIDLDGNPSPDAAWPVNPAGFVDPLGDPRAHAERALRDAHAHDARHRGGLSQGRPAHDNFYGAMLYGRVAYHDFEGITVDGRAARLVRTSATRRADPAQPRASGWGPSVPEAFLMMWTLQRACDVQFAASRAGEIHPIRPEVFPQTVRESGPGEKRTCEDAWPPCNASSTRSILPTGSSGCLRGGLA